VSDRVVPFNTPLRGVGRTNSEVRRIDTLHDSGAFYREPEFWVAVGFVLFVALLLYLKVHKSAGAALDARGAKIKADLDDAARLRREAEALLATAEARLAASAGDAAAIVAQAARSAEEIRAAAERDLDALIARRTKAADDRIAAAERAAETAIRAKAVDLAVDQARRLIVAESDTATQDRLTAAAISELDRRLH
jgi:F-type H+-transporting ATPase subunit b